MSNYSTDPRILIVTPEPAFILDRRSNRTNFISANAGGFGDFQAELISNLFELGVDVHVAQPDFREIFANSSWNEKTGVNAKLPGDRVHLAEDRVIFYSNPINLNSERENIKISLAFQREVINQIVPRVQPDLIHCYDWMTGLIPAAARKIEIPSLFTAHKFDTAGCLLSYVEDRGIDVAAFWQHLFYDRYPINYGETRATNPVDFLLSGVFAAQFATTSRSAFLANEGKGQSRLTEFPLWEVLVKKIASGCALVNKHRTKAAQYIEIYEKMLQRAVLQPNVGAFHIPHDKIQHSLNI